MKQKMISAATALAAVVIYGAVAGGHAPGPRGAGPAPAFPPDPTNIPPGDAPECARKRPDFGEPH